MRYILITTSLLLAVVTVFEEVKTSNIEHNGKSLMIHPSTGCSIPQNAMECITQDGITIDILNAEIVTQGVICICLENNYNKTIGLICEHQGYKHVWIDTSEFPGELLIRKKRVFGESGALIGAGAGMIIGGPLGSAAGAAIGGGIGAVVDVVCFFFCRRKPTYKWLEVQRDRVRAIMEFEEKEETGKDESSPPNTPPELTCAVLKGPNPIEAGAGTPKAVIEWTKATAYDKEDGTLSVKTFPDYKSGDAFPEGQFHVSFRAADGEGYARTCNISFTVKVLRCNPPRWPENGIMECEGGGDLIWGSTCLITCKNGYQLDETSTNSIKCNRNHWSKLTPDCNPKPCKVTPQVSNGTISCFGHKAAFGSVCIVICEDGYRRQGDAFVYCDENGEWNAPSTCADQMSPVFDLGSCPNDIQVNIDASNTAMVSWDVPTGTDNSGQSPVITENNLFKPGQKFPAGYHTIRYEIVDSSNNKGYPCTFVVQVQTISCEPPSLNVAGGKHMLYDCPQMYRLGAVCTLSCRSGYPLGGVDEIQCLNDGSYPPKLDWTWDQNGLKPFCKETLCPDLPAPANGALVCSIWDHGNMCQQQCQEGYDVPLIRDGMFVCGKSDGRWRPDDNVPDCNKKRNSNQMNLQSDLYYYTGICNSSADNLMEIKENFVKALNTSKYHEHCVGVPECKAEFVNVTCGPTTSRRKRSIATYLTKRSSTRLAYTVTFDFLLPFDPASGQSIASAFLDNQNILYDMFDSIQTDVDNGHFNMPGKDMTIERDSLGAGTPEFSCPEGTMPKQETASCSGCPAGRFFSKTTRDCQYCPVGTYQDTPYSLECKSCPPGTNTTHEGAVENEMCLEYCKSGFHSPLGLSPCVACDSSSFQPYEMSTSCIACEPGKRTKSEGSIKKSLCQSYDILLDHQRSVSIKSKIHASSFTLSTWMFLLRKTEHAILFHWKSADEADHFTVSFKQNLVIETNGSTFDTGKALLSSKWYHIVVSVDATGNSLEVYINGKKVYDNKALPVAITLPIEIDDTLEIRGGMQLSSYNVLSHTASLADVVKWSSTCESTSIGSILTSDVIASSQSINVIIPSMCDAVDECESSPCGRHTCINKQGSYECRCLDGYTGNQCTIKPDFCIDNACQHGATCVDGASNYTCSCTYGYSGDLCDKKAVDGGWSDWTDWTQCSMSCGGGQTSRTRQCNSPSPDPEGAPCQGSSSESIDCNEDKCPECTRLMRAYGVVPDCNITDTLTRCTLSCRPGLYFTTQPMPYYECGEITDYKWNHQNEDNPRARLPACSEVKPPVEMEMLLDGHYQTMDCSDSNGDVVVKSLQTKLTSLECVQQGSCKTRIVPKSCNNNSRKRRSGNTLTVSIILKSTVKTDGSDFNFEAFVGNESAPSASIVDFLKQALELEKSAQQIFNNSVDFFQVTVDGRNQTVDSNVSGVSVTPLITCPPGSIRLDAFCGECPAGSYSDGHTVYLCQQGQYQDQTGQITCKQCPQGKTTPGTGSVDISECEELDGSGSKNGNGHKTSGDKEDEKIAIGVCVSFVLLVLAGAAIVFVYKYTTKRNRVKDSMLNLQNVYPDTYVVASKPSYQKHPL